MTIKQRILLVDDEETVLHVLRNSLRKWDDEYEVITATNGYDALQAMQQRPFDLVVTDYRMDDMDGLELMDAVHADYPETRVILITAYGSDNLSKEAHRLDVYRYLLKPLEIPTFRRIVRETLDNRDMAFSRSGLLVLSDMRYQEITALLERLQGDIGARCIILTDSNGQVIANTGDMSGFHVEEIASLLSGGMATLQAAGEALDSDKEAINLSYREGAQDNLYAINIGQQLLLIVIIENSPYSSRLGTAWYYARQTAVTLCDLLGQTEAGSVSFLLDDNVDGGLDEAFDGLFNENLFDE